MKEYFQTKLNDLRNKINTLNCNYKINKRIEECSKTTDKEICKKIYEDLFYLCKK